MVSFEDSEKIPRGGHHRDYVWTVVLIVLANLAITGAVSAATPITGPTVISIPGNYYLADDITNSGAKVCIEITAPNVVLNGNGKTIDGAGAADSYGIRVFNSARTLFNVVIKNIFISDWGTGLYMQDVKNSQLEMVTASGNAGNGIFLQTAVRNTIKTCSATANGATGFLVFWNSDSNTLSGNTASGNGDDGLRIRFASNNEVLNNKLLNNQGSGLNLNEESNFNTVTGNTVSGNVADGIRVWKANGNIITRNTVRNNANGIRVYESSDNNEISDNTVLENTYNGVLLINTLSSTNSNMVTGNTLDNNNDSGIRIVRSNRNTVTGNYVRNNVDEGIYMWNASSNLIVNNYFYNNNNSVFVSGLPANTWNLPQSALRSITGGANSGGNSWAQPNGQGFSQITQSTNGICNQPYKLANNNVDNLPLKYTSRWGNYPYI